MNEANIKRVLYLAEDEDVSGHLVDYGSPGEDLVTPIRVTSVRDHLKVICRDRHSKNSSPMTANAMLHVPTRMKAKGMKAEIR